MFRQCAAAQAEVELYAITGAPATLTRTITGRQARPARNGRPAVSATPDRQVTFANGKALVMHAHRRDFPALDAAPNRGCSSKLAAGPLVAHNRLALADTRTWAQNGNPQIVYGAIYQWWQRDPGAHPTFAANAAIEYPVPGHHPDDRIYASGYGTYPAGHPGNTIGLPPPAGNNNNTLGATGASLVRRPGSSASTNSSSSSTTSSHSRNSSQTSVSSGAASRKGVVAAPVKAAPRKPWVLLAASGKSYPNIPLIPPYARIPPASSAAVKAAAAAAGAVNKANAPLVAAFTKAWAAFLAAWAEMSRRSLFCDDASVCTQTPEFRELVGLAGSKLVQEVIALVVWKLSTEPRSFVGVFVYNYLQRDKDYLVYAKDLFNYNVLQRHANLVVEMNAVPKK